MRVVSSAAGINETRGDVISVEPMPFSTEARDRQAAEEAAEQKRQDRILYMELGALILLTALLLGGFLMYRRKKRQEREAEEAAIRAEEEARRAEEEAQRRAEEEERARAIEENLIDDEGLTPTEKQQRDEKQAILKMIDEKPADVAMLIKTWLAEDE